MLLFRDMAQYKLFALVLELLYLNNIVIMWYYNYRLQMCIDIGRYVHVISPRTQSSHICLDKTITW